MPCNDRPGTSCQTETALTRREIMDRKSGGDVCATYIINPVITHTHVCASLAVQTPPASRVSYV